MRKVRMFLFTIAVVVALSVLAFGIVAPNTVHVVSEPVHLLAEDDPGGGQGGGGGG